jgi:hypothetical protein
LLSNCLRHQNFLGFVEIWVLNEMREIIWILNILDNHWILTWYDNWLDSDLKLETKHQSLCIGM